MGESPVPLEWHEHNAEGKLTYAHATCLQTFVGVTIGKKESWEIVRGAPCACWDDHQNQTRTREAGHVHLWGR